MLPIDENLVFSSNQTTLARSIECVGVALHSGKNVSLKLKPAKPNTGIVFKRADLPGMPEIQANWKNVVDTKMCTTIGDKEGTKVSTIEHLMAAFSGCHVDNAIVEILGSEVPAMDGSAQPFVFLIECAGIKQQDETRRIIEVLKPIEVESEGRIAKLLPSNSFSVGFQIEFDDCAISRQELYITLVNGTFKKEIARARTFGFANDVEALRASGLALGGSLENAVIVDGDKVLNDDGLRYEDEFVRHKVLDAVGDLYLSGAPILGHYRGFRSGHHMTNELLKAMFADSTSWKYSDFKGDSGIPGQIRRGDITNDAAKTLVATA